MRTDWLLGQPFAHRGLHDAQKPENSLAAIEAAAEHGYGVELDVRLLADNRPVVFHDADLERMTGNKGLVSAHTSTTIKELRLLGTDQTPPLLDQVLEVTAGHVPLYIEVKNEASPGLLEMTILKALERAEKRQGRRGPWAIASFNPAILVWFRETAPWLPRGQIAMAAAHYKNMNLFKKRRLARLGYARRADPDFIAYDLRGLPNKWVQRERDKGRAVIAWTARNPGDMARALELADNVVFEGFRP